MYAIFSTFGEVEFAHVKRRFYAKKKFKIGTVTFTSKSGADRARKFRRILLDFDEIMIAPFAEKLTGGTPAEFQAFIPLQNAG